MKVYSKPTQNWIGGFWLVSVALALLGLLTPNPLESAVAAIFPAVLLQILWRPNEPQILFLAALMQAAQAIVPVLVANRNGLAMDAQTQVSTYSQAFYFSILALLCVALGARMGAGQGLKRFIRSSSFMESMLVEKKLLVGYIIALILYLITPFLAAYSGGLYQVLLPLGAVRLVFAYSIFRRSFIKSRLNLSAFSILVAETVIGITGFFAGFKSIYLVLILAIVSSGKLSPRFLGFRVIPSLLAFLVFVGYWQNVKVDYRHYVTLGQGTQALSVPLGERIDFHLDSLPKVKSEHIVEGLISGIDRLGYLDYFANSIQQVPSHVPYQNGRLWWEAVEFTTQPRFLFPNKPIANDSDRTNAFTGLRVADSSQGTSISIGYVGESYIDFGFPLMLIPIFAIGWIWGRFYRILLTVRPMNPFNFGAASVLILRTATLFETSNLKLLPAVVINFLVFWLLLKLLAARGNHVWQWFIRE